MMKKDKEGYFVMDDIIVDNEIKLRRLTDEIDDYVLLTKWYQEEEIYSHFEQRKLSYEEVRNKYFFRTKEDAKIPVYMIEYIDEPIGIVQYQKISKENLNLYKLDEENSYEVDIFLGEIKLHNKGIGRRVIEMVSKYLFDIKKAKLIVMCPLYDNKNAIKCYKNAGFKEISCFETEDTIGDIQKFVLMIREK